MKKYYTIGFSILSIALLTVVSTGFMCQQSVAKKAVAASNKVVPNEADKSFSVLELFTSEGCSSCPPADELIGKIKAESHNNLFILAYHVDYWNRLGWKDVFSKPEWSARQQEYAKHLATEGVYTPQLVVNGHTEFVGSNEIKLRNELAKNTAAGESKLIITVAKAAGNLVHVTYEARTANPSLLNIALVQTDAVTQIKRGENKGRELHHVYIVRELKTIELSNINGSVDIEIPAELKNIPFSIISFIQQKDNFLITAAAKASL